MPIRVAPRPNFVLVDDASLAQAAAQGQRAAAGAIWDRFSPLVRGVVRRLLGPDSEAEDLVQEVFLKLFRDIATLRDAEALRGFILQVTTRTAMSELRRRRVRRWVGLTYDGALPEVDVRPAVDAPARLAIVALYRILDSLSVEARAAFVLHRIEEMELHDVAATMNVSLATVKRRLADAEARLERMASRDPALRAYVPCATRMDDTESGSVMASKGSHA